MSWNIHMDFAYGEYWMHHVEGAKRKVIARFKYNKPKTRANSFRKFLEKNFEVSEYFEMRESGMAPITILETKGYDYREKMIAKLMAQRSK